jgi:hypothetical protein
LCGEGFIGDNCICSGIIGRILLRFVLMEDGSCRNGREGSFSIDPSTGNRLTLFSRRSRAWRRLFFLQPLLLLGVPLLQLLCLLLVPLFDLLLPGFIGILSCELLVFLLLRLLKFLPVSFLLRV